MGLQSALMMGSRMTGQVQRNAGLGLVIFVTRRPNLGEASSAEVQRPTLKLVGTSLRNLLCASHMKTSHGTINVKTSFIKKLLLCPRCRLHVSTSSKSMSLDPS